MKDINTRYIDNQLEELGIPNVTYTLTPKFTRDNITYYCKSRLLYANKSIYDNFKLLADECEELVIYPDPRLSHIWYLGWMSAKAAPGNYGWIKCVQINPKQ